MKPTFLWIPVLLLAQACSESQASEMTQQPGSVPQPAGSPIDEAISDRVRDAILADAKLSAEADWVRVVTQDGVVTLLGTVRDASTKDRMEKLVRSVGSVVRVDNRLAVGPVPEVPQEPMESTLDRAISDRVRTALFDDSAVAPEAGGIRVHTREGVVTLLGTLSRPAVKERAKVVASAVGSVVRVEDGLVVRD